jgi:hypothetical protein
VKGIQVCSNQGDNPSTMGDNSERVNFKKFFSRTSRPNSIILDTNFPWKKEFKFVQIKGQVLFNGEIIKNVKMGWGNFKILFLRTMKPEKMNFT